MKAGLTYYSLLRLFTYSCLFFMAESLYAQTKFYSQVSATSVPLNGTFEYSVVVENGSIEKINQLYFPNFKVLSGPNTSQSAQMTNGNISSSFSYSYILQPTQKGTFTIPKVKAVVEDVEVEGKEIKIVVTDPVKQQPRQSSQNPFDPFGNDPFAMDPFFNRTPPAQISEEEVRKKVAENVFLKLELDKNNVYQGEKVTATLKLYFRADIKQFGLTKSPKFDGFWNKELPQKEQKAQHIETINGVRYNAVELVQYNLFPQKTGALKISAAEADMVVQIALQSNSRSIFDQFFGGQVYSVVHKSISNAAVVNVKELPTAGKPENFSGAIGDFKYNVSISSKEGKTDEPITYIAKVSGTGNMDMLSIPAPKIDESFEVYEPQTVENFSEGDAGFSGTKQDEYTIMPTMPGAYKFEPTSFCFFNPAAAKYVTINSPEININITGEPSKKSVLIDSAGAKTAEQLIVGKKIKNIHSPLVYQAPSKKLFGSVPFLVLTMTPFVLLVGLFAYKKREENLSADVIGVQQRRATKIAKKRLVTAEKHLKNNEREKFYDEVSRAIWGYLGNKLNIDPSLLSKENVSEKLAAKSVDEATIASLINVIEHSELALYTPTIMNEKMKADYEDAVRLIADLEQKIK